MPHATPRMGVLLNGVRRASPSPFYVYSSVVVVHVPAVTASDGHRQCATTSRAPAGDFVSTIKGCVRTISGINSNLRSFFSRTGKSDPSSYTVTCEPRKDDPATRLEASTITFETPKIHIPNFPNAVYVASPPLEQALGIDELIDLDADPGHENFYAGADSKLPFGWLPENINELLSEYHDLASCLPGGPEILLGSDWCTSVAPVMAIPAITLTSSSQFTVTSPGCFHPGTCPTGNTVQVNAEPGSTARPPAPSIPTDIPKADQPAPVTS